MVLKVFVSGMSGNKEVKKRQQRVLMILDSKNIKYEVIDITEPGKESEKEYMQTTSTSNGATVSDPTPRHPLPPQIFNNNEYCGDYDAFDLANEIDTLEQFLKLAPPDVTNVTSAQIELKKENCEKIEGGDGVIIEDNKENQEVKENGQVNEGKVTAINESKVDENETEASSIDEDKGKDETEKKQNKENVSTGKEPETEDKEPEETDEKVENSKIENTAEGESANEKESGSKEIDITSETEEKEPKKTDKAEENSKIENTDEGVNAEEKKSGSDGVDIKSETEEKEPKETDKEEENSETGNTTGKKEIVQKVESEKNPDSLEIENTAENKIRKGSENEGIDAKSETEKNVESKETDSKEENSKTENTVDVTSVDKNEIENGKTDIEPDSIVKKIEAPEETDITEENIETKDNYEEKDGTKDGDQTVEEETEDEKIEEENNDSSGTALEDPFGEEK